MPTLPPPSTPAVVYYAAQTTRYVSAPIGLGSTASIISSLRGQCYVGAPIVAANVRAIVDLYNTWIYHYHSADDLIGVDTFGNVPRYGGGYWTTQNTGYALDGSAAPFVGGLYPTYMYTDNLIYASEFNQIITYVNSTGYHFHSIEDVNF